MKAVIITGTRHDERKGEVASLLDSEKPGLVIVGDATGVDAEARDWCSRNGVDILVSTAHWKKLGGPAGPRRNAVLVRTAEAYRALGWDVSFAAFPGPYSAGTWQCVGLLKRAAFVGQVFGGGSR